jgi:hypothetical protein
LIGGFIFVNYSLFTGEIATTLITLLQCLILPVAFLLTIYSVRMTNIWARRPYPEQAIEEGLKGISKKSVMYHYYHFPARHVLIAPQGVFAITTRWHNGRFAVDEGKWTTFKNPLSKFFSMMRMDGVGNPTVEAQRAANHIEALLESVGAEVDVQPLIIFTDPTVEVAIKQPEVPVLFADDKRSPNLTEFLRELNRQQKENPQQRVTLPVSPEQIEAFEAKTIK